MRWEGRKDSHPPAPNTQHQRQVEEQFVPKEHNLLQSLLLNIPPLSRECGNPVTDFIL